MNGSAAKRNLFSKGSFLFLTVVLLEFLIAGYLAISRRMVAGHDGLNYLGLQYYFLNGVVTSGQIPQWMPFMAQGTVAALWYAMQGSLLQNAVLFLGGLVKDLNFLTLFSLGIFVDTLLLLTGTWLLSRRLFRSPYSRLFVAIAVTGSAIWTSPLWFNLHFTYALPLILHLIHRLLETGRWRYFLLAGNLLALQTIGNLPYFLPAVALAIFLYFLFYGLVNLHEVQRQVRALRWGLPFLGSLLLTLGFFLLAFAALKMGTGQLAHQNVGRSPDGTVALGVFLTYGGNQGFAKWWELLLRISPGRDYTLYIGLLTVPLAILGILWGPRRGAAPFFLVGLAFLLFSMGTPVAVLFYHLWPGMPFYRHIGFLACFVKFCLCFLAGFGWEAIYLRSQGPLPHPKGLLSFRAPLVLCALCMMGLSIWLFHLARNPDGAADLVATGIFPRECWEFFPDILARGILGSQLTNAALAAALGSLFFLGLALRSDLPRARMHLIALGLALHLCDLYGYKLSDLLLKTYPLSKDQYTLTSFQEMPYQKRRHTTLEAAHPRAAQLVRLPLFGVLYGAMHSFLFFDQAGSSLRLDYWELPLDQFMRAYWKQPIKDASIKPAGLIQFRGLLFPLEHPAAGKFSGVTEEKIQFFSSACTVEEEGALALAITDPRYSGNILFLSPGKNGHPENARPWREGGDLAENARLALGYQVRRFDANRLEVVLQAPGKSVWMLYSDVWHPWWKATANGREVPVYKANLAYKAVLLPGGECDVRFSFGSPWLALCYRGFGAFSVFWLIFLAGTAGKILWKETCSVGHPPR